MIGGAHKDGTCGRIDLQGAARLLDFVSFEEFDLDRGEARGSRRTDASEAQSPSELGIKRLEATIHSVHGIALHEKGDVQDNAVRNDRLDDGIDCHAAKRARQPPGKSGAPMLQRVLDQSAERSPPRRGRALRAFLNLLLEPGNGLFLGDTGKDSIKIPGDEDFQLCAPFQLGEGPLEQTAAALEGSAYGHLIRRLRAEFDRQDRCRTYELLDDLLMGQQQSPQLFAGAALQTLGPAAADDGRIRSLADHLYATGKRFHTANRTPAVRLVRDDGINIDRVFASGFGLRRVHSRCSWPGE